MRCAGLPLQAAAARLNFRARREEGAARVECLLRALRRVPRGTARLALRGGLGPALMESLRCLAPLLEAGVCPHGSCPPAACPECVSARLPAGSEPDWPALSKRLAAFAEGAVEDDGAALRMKLQALRRLSLRNL
eukprot:tig00000189_g14309.t1